MRVVRKGGQYFVELEAGEKVTYNRPSVDVMFDSVAEYVGKNAVCVLMTGMGKDGGQGMLTMQQHGALTIAQDEASCVVFGMPKEAIRLGGVAEVLPLDEVAARLVSHLKQVGRGNRV
mgnify:CR=1 FL=1